MLFVAYYRVSTAAQGLSGLGLEAQRQSVTAYLASCGGTLLDEFQEVESGSFDARPKLQVAIRLCKQKRATLLIAKLDRLSRNVGTIANHMNSDVPFVAVDMPQADRFTLHIMAAVAERERQLTSERTTAALKIAKARGVVLGNPRIASARPLAAVAKRINADRFARSLIHKLGPMRHAGCTLQQLADSLNEAAIPTSQGRVWYPQTVKNLLARLECLSAYARRPEGTLSVSSQGKDDPPIDKGVGVVGHAAPKTDTTPDSTVSAPARMHSGLAQSHSTSIRIT
jgi:DNA invertase Pin-like site-specific DNA recombinase